MKKLTQTEIEFEKNVYDSNFKSVDSGWEYMRKHGYSHGGWQMVAKNAVLLRNLYVYILEICKALNIDVQKVDEIFTKPAELKQATMSLADKACPQDLFNALFPPLPKEFRTPEDYIALDDACCQLSEEGYDLQWDPSQIRLYMKRHPDQFENTFVYKPGPGKKQINKYFVRKEKLLEDMRKYPFQNASQKKLINQFAEWRKTQKSKGHC